MESSVPAGLVQGAGGDTGGLGAGEPVFVCVCVCVAGIVWGERYSHPMLMPEWDYCAPVHMLMRGILPDRHAAPVRTGGRARGDRDCLGSQY